VLEPPPGGSVGGRGLGMTVALLEKLVAESKSE